MRGSQSSSGSWSSSKPPHQLVQMTHHNLDMFPPEMKAYVKPNIVILGVAIGDLYFCSSFIATKRMEARALISQLEQVGLVDP